MSKRSLRTSSTTSIWKNKRNEKPLRLRVNLKNILNRSEPKKKQCGQQLPPPLRLRRILPLRQGERLKKSALTPKNILGCRKQKRSIPSTSSAMKLRLNCSRQQLTDEWPHKRRNR